MNLTSDEIKSQLTDIIALLHVPGIGRGRYHRLVNTFGSISNVVKAPGKKLEGVAGISTNIARAIKENFDREAALVIASKVIQLGWAPLHTEHDEYPEPVKMIPDPPALLFRDGDPFDNEVGMIAIVGTRHPTESGKRFTMQLAGELARSGITVVSGLAEGIDSAAHQGALDAGGKTIAVLGNSIDIVYPRSNKSLMGKIREQGAIYSEYFPGTKPDPAYFPERNRIISGLSTGTVVVEAGEKSGALLTANHALEQGRELFAVPGAPDGKMSIGTNRLIKQGARLLTSIEDIFEEIPRLKGEVAVKRVVTLPEMTHTEKSIVSMCGEQPVQLDSLARQLGLPMADVMEFLLALELKGIIQEIAGKRFILSDSYR